MILLTGYERGWVNVQCLPQNISLGTWSKIETYFIWEELSIALLHAEISNFMRKKNYFTNQSAYSDRAWANGHGESYPFLSKQFLISLILSYINSVQNRQNWFIPIFMTAWLRRITSNLFPNSEVLAEPGLTPAVAIMNTMLSCNHSIASNIIKLSSQMWKYQRTFLCTQNSTKNLILSFHNWTSTNLCRRLRRRTFYSYRSKHKHKCCTLNRGLQD